MNIKREEKNVYLFKQYRILEEAFEELNSKIESYFIFL